MIHSVSQCELLVDRCWSSMDSVPVLGTWTTRPRYAIGLFTLSSRTPRSFLTNVVLDTSPLILARIVILHLITPNTASHLPSCLLVFTHHSLSDISPPILNPNPPTNPHRLFPINFLLLKLNHHLLALSASPPSSPLNTLASSLCASSCLTCPKYCFSCSASLLLAGALKSWFRGKPGSPGMAKLLSSAIFCTSFCASLFCFPNQLSPLNPSQPSLKPNIIFCL